MTTWIVQTLEITAALMGSRAAHWGKTAIPATCLDASWCELDCRGRHDSLAVLGLLSKSSMSTAAGRMSSL